MAYAYVCLACTNLTFEMRETGNEKENKRKLTKRVHRVSDDV